MRADLKPVSQRQPSSGKLIRRALRRAEALPVLRGDDERPGHLGAADAAESHCRVSHVLAGDADAIELHEPEVVAREVVVGRVVRVAPQVAVVLRQDEGRGVPAVVDRAARRHRKQSGGTPLGVSGAEGRQRRVALFQRRRHFRVLEQLIHELRGGYPLWEFRQDFGALPQPCAKSSMFSESCRSQSPTPTTIPS